MNAVHAVLALALVTTVGAGVVLHSVGIESADLVTIEGTVTSVEWNPHFNATVEVMLQDVNGTNYSVELAPPWWWAEQHLPTISVNDTLKVQGELGEGNEIEAWTVWINGGSAIVLRTGEMPPWAQERSGHTGGSESNETDDDGPE